MRQHEEAVKGPCEFAENAEPPQTAKIGQKSFSGLAPVYGCRDVTDTETLVELEWQAFSTHGYQSQPTDCAALKEARSAFAKLEARGQCHTLPAGQSVKMVECRYELRAPYLAHIRMQNGETLWMPCSGLVTAPEAQEAQKKQNVFLGNFQKRHGGYLPAMTFL